MSRLHNWALLLACNLIWGSQFVFLKVVQQQAGPLFTTFFPLALATLALIPLVHRRGPRPAPGGLSRRDLVGFILLGVFGQFVVLLFGTYGVRLTLASNAAVVGLSLPVTTAVMAYFLLGERLTVIRVVSFALALTGVLECAGINWGELNFASRQFLLGNLMCFLSVLGSAFYNTYSKKLLERHPPLRVVLYSYYGAFLLLLPITLYGEWQSFRDMLNFKATVWVGLVFLALLRNFLALVIFLWVLSRLDATVAALSNYLIPFFGLLTASVFLHERLTGPMFLGGMLVLASTLLMTVYEGRQSRSAAARASAAEP